jgi:intracellular multiplication protein IcmL
MQAMKDALKLVTLRNAFYKDGFRRLSCVLLMSLLLNVILVCSVLFLSFHRPPARYFATTPQGKLIALKPRNEPVLSSTAISDWVARSVPQIFDIDFLNYRKQVMHSRDYFTSYGWEQFLEHFSITLNKIKTDKLVAHAVVTDVPYVTRQGIVKGVYTWQVQVPLLVTYQKGSEEETQHLVWTVLLKRVDNNISDQLVGIAQVVQTIQDTSGDQVEQ